jgi:hypothetical protein
MSASLAEVAPAVSTMLLGSNTTRYPLCSDMNRANACGDQVHIHDDRVSFSVRARGSSASTKWRIRKRCHC